MVKNPPAGQETRDVGLIPGLGRSPGEGNGNPLQYSCLGNSMGWGARPTVVHGVAKESDTTLGLNINKIYFQDNLFFFSNILNFLFFIRVEPINIVVIDSGKQWRDSAIHVHASILSQTSLLSRLPHNIEQSSMCYTTGPCYPFKI